jgi:general secretion pathway protein D
MKKIIILLVLLVIYSVAKDYKNINLSDFVQVLSQTTNKNIVMSDTIKKDFHIYLPSYDFKNKKISIKLLNNILEINNLTSKTIDDVILIYKPKPKIEAIKDEPLPPVESSYIIKYKYLDIDDIQKYLISLYPNVKNTILKNRLLLYTTQNKHDEIKQQIDSLDNSFLQRNIQVTIIGTLNKNEEDIGLDFKALHINAGKYIELITSKVNFTSPLTEPTQFFAFINLMVKNGTTRLLDNPNITLSDKKNAVIESTQNIPYLTTTTSTKDTQTVKQDSYEYKDVGLKVNFTNVVISETHLDVDLDIYIQSILEKSITPVIASRHVQTHITLDINSSVVLGGLSSRLEYQKKSGIPVIEYVPLLGTMTSHEITEVKDETFTIIISN